MKKTLFSILLIGICMTGVANAKEKNPILLKQVYKKEELQLQEETEIHSIDKKSISFYNINIKK